LPNDFIAEAVILTKGYGNARLCARASKQIPREYFPEILARVQPLQLGPLIEWPVQYRISGPDVQTLQRLTYQVADIVASSPDTRNINFDWIEPIRAIRVRVDQAKVRRIGIRFGGSGAAAQYGHERPHDYPGS
jgi:multidrug efflux pump subunit AcrB